MVIFFGIRNCSGGYMNMKKKLILIGAGDRGQVYASYALKNPDKLNVVAVADPNGLRRERVAKTHGIGPSNQFDGWEDILSRPQMADGAIIATQDSLHVGPAVKALELGYEVLLEKPMALTRNDCEALVEVSRKTGRTLNVCHVLRYTDFFSKIKEVIQSGIIGEIYTIFHAENVAYYHMAHSYVRGNWRSIALSSPIILAKCCHDLDLIAWFAGSRPRKINSVGVLSHFKPENAPPGAPGRCTDGCPEEKECLYNAVDTYLYGKHLKLALAKEAPIPIALAANAMLKYPRLSAIVPGLKQYLIWKEWPTSTITDDLSKDGIMTALKTGPYGRCVYFCDNDQVDHQETAIEFENGITAILRMHGHSEIEGRTIRIDGSKGTLKGKFGGKTGLDIHIHASKKITYKLKADILGHSEGDNRIMENFLQVMNGGKGQTDAAESLVSHNMAFAAHESRLENRVVEL
jgi:predicted dehydrogenase